MIWYFSLITPLLGMDVYWGRKGMHAGWADYRSVACGGFSLAKKGNLKVVQ